MSNLSWGGDPRRNQPPWLWPVVIDARPAAKPESEPATPVRIGDAERDQAVSALGDHFAAGRLSREELDERIDQAMSAKFSTDLEPLFADLPKPAEPRPAGQAGQGFGPGFGPRQRTTSPLFLIFPMMVVALVVTAFALGAPWMLWGLVWILLLGRFWGGRFGGGRWAGPYRGPHGPGARPGPPSRRF